MDKEERDGMKRIVIAASLAFVMMVQIPCYAEMSADPQESVELKYQDMLMLFLKNKKISRSWQCKKVCAMATLS